jgi:hypothetical protein
MVASLPTTSWLTAPRPCLAPAGGAPAPRPASPVEPPRTLLCSSVIVCCGCGGLAPTPVLGCGGVTGSPRPLHLPDGMEALTSHSMGQRAWHPCSLWGLDEWWLVSKARWEPQEEGMMSTAASLPSVMKPRFNRTSWRKPNFRRWCLLASWHSGQGRQIQLLVGV